MNDQVFISSLSWWCATHGIEWQLQVECATSGLGEQGVGEQCRVCVCNADIGSINRREFEQQNIHFLVEHGDAPNTCWRQKWG